MAGYSVVDYGGMIADTARMNAYAAALRRAIAPTSVVVDIGTGTGVLALTACALGARRVIAIEPGPAIEVARESALVNGYADRIEFKRARSTEVELEEPADVIVSDLRGVLPLCGHHLEVVIDARRRFLRPEGALMPQRDLLMAAPVESPETFEGLVGGFRNATVGIDLESQRTMALNSWTVLHARDVRLLSEPSSWCELDYRIIEGPHARGVVNWTATASGVAHGLAVWFEAHLLDGIRYASGPMRKDSTYGTAFFPFLEPVALTAGEQIAVDLAARLVGNGYVFRWTTETAHARFEQSTFQGTPLSAAELERRSPAHVPKLSARGMAAREALSLMGDGRSNEEIAEHLLDRAPDVFATLEDARQLVGQLANEYAR